MPGPWPHSSGGTGSPGGPGRDPRRSLLTLYRLTTGYRILYTGVLVFFVAGFATGLARQALRAGLSPEGFAAWWLGNLGEPSAARMLFPKAGHEVLDAVWRASLRNVLAVVVMLALLFRSSASRAVYRGLALALVTFALVDVGAPPLLRYGGDAFGTVALAAEVGLAGTALTACLYCLRDMWLQPTRGPRFRAVSGGNG